MSAVETLDPRLRSIASMVRSGARLADVGNPQPWWQQHMVWLLVLVGLVVFALLAARVAQIRRRRASGTSGH